MVVATTLCDITMGIVLFFDRVALNNGSCYQKRCNGWRYNHIQSECNCKHYCSNK